MNRMSLCLVLSSLFVLVYSIGMHHFPLQITLMFFGLTPLPVLAVVFGILKHNKQPELTFDEAMYEDLRIPYKRNQGGTEAF